MTLKNIPKYLMDKDVVSTAVNQNGLALKFSHPYLRSNKNIVSVAVCQNGVALRHATKSLRRDKEIVFTATINNENALKYAHKSLRRNDKFMQEIHEFQMTEELNQLYDFTD
jgi:hypothetical protein